MNQLLPRPILIFRFALREGDWLLAAALAEALRANRDARRQLEAELSRTGSQPPEGPGSLGALRVFRRLARRLGLNLVAL
jgi:hypothetical protein